MSIYEKSEQNAGDGGVNLHAGGSIVIGVSYTEAKVIAQELFDKNFRELTGVAADEASDRAAEFRAKFLNEAERRKPEGIAAAADPSFQYDLFEAQKEFAKAGEQELGNLLVDILVDRAEAETRSLRQIVLSEALSVAPKLTPEQYEVLACCFRLQYTRYGIFRVNTSNFEALTRFIERDYICFSDALLSKSRNLEHLSFLGCGSVDPRKRSVPNLFRSAYPSMFNKGFSEQAAEDLFQTDSRFRSVVGRNPHYPENYQAIDIDTAEITSTCSKVGLGSEQIERLLNLHNAFSMSESEASDLLHENIDGFAKFSQAFDASPASRFTLTSVGIAIAHSYLKRHFGVTTGLDEWI